MEQEEFTSGRHFYRKVVLAFSIDESADRPESSDEKPDPDYDAKRDHDDEEDHQATVVPNAGSEIIDTESIGGNEEEEETTLTITLDADGTSTMYQPLGFTRITQVVEAGRILTESEQLGELVHHVMPLLDLSQIEIVAAREISHV